MLYINHFYIFLNMNNNNRTNNNNKALSLIELSIVLIIIGLLVAGIIGGKSLVDGAKVYTAISELRKFKQELYSFKLLKNRLPGDLTGSGKIGKYGDQSYNNNSFGGNYVSNNINYGIPTNLVGPFVDLFLNNISDFEPKKTVPKIGELNDMNGGSPLSKSLDCWYFFELGQRSNSSSHAKYLMPEKTFIVCRKYPSPTRKLKYFMKIDEKIDDGIWNMGDFRSRVRYDNLNSNGSHHFFYAVE